jgi:hypothetical protein
MKRKPTTNPKIDGQPASFVRLGSAVAGPLKLIVQNEKGKGTVYRVRGEQQP